MYDRSLAKLNTTWAPLRWLTDPRAEVAPEARPVLLGQLVSSPMAIVLGAINSLVVSTVGLARHGGEVLASFMAIELCLLLCRIFVIWRIHRAQRAGQVPGIEFAVGLSVLWCAVQGGLAFFIMQTGDMPLMLLCVALIMALTGPICARNYSAPRLAMLLVCLCDLPLKVGAVMSGEPWLLILLPMTILFLLGAMQIVTTFNKVLVSALNSEVRNSYLATHDALTGLLNRQGLEAVIAALPATEDRMIAVLEIDLDGFKLVNDRHGHVAGDMLLKEVAVRLAASLRPGDVLARIGGDEFVVIIRNMQDSAVARTADQLIASVADGPYHIGGAAIRVGASIGYACYPDDAQTIDALRIQADSALYAAKRSGKGTGVRYATAPPPLPSSSATTSPWSAAR